MKRHTTYLIIAALATLGFTGCTSTMDTVNTPKYKRVPYQKPTPEKSAVFQESMMKVALSTQDDSKYQKIELDTPEKKAWFKDLMYRLWDRQITRDDFILEGLTQYPTHKYEFEFVANGFQKHS